MTKSILFPIAMVALAIAIAGFIINGISSGKINIGVNNSSSNQQDTKDYVEINGHKINIEIASTEDVRQQGLSQRTSLEKDSGMLFVFDQQDVQPVFWMKDMFIPLDIIWINDQKITKIDTNVQPPPKDTPDSQLDKYFAPSPIDYVLEVNANYSKDHDIKIGDSVDLSNAEI